MKKVHFPYLNPYLMSYTAISKGSLFGIISSYDQQQFVVNLRKPHFARYAIDQTSKMANVNEKKEVGSGSLNGHASELFSFF